MYHCGKRGKGIGPVGWVDFWIQTSSQTRLIRISYSSSKIFSPNLLILSSPLEFFLNLNYNDFYLDIFMIFSRTNTHEHKKKSYLIFKAKTILITFLLRHYNTSLMIIYYKIYIQKKIHSKRICISQQKLIGSSKEYGRFEKTNADPVKKAQ